MRRPKQPKWKETTVRRSAEPSLSQSQNRPGCHSAQQRSLTGPEEINSATSSPRAKFPLDRDAERPWTGSRSPAPVPLSQTTVVRDQQQPQTDVPILLARHWGRSRRWPNWPRQPSPFCRGIRVPVPSMSRGIHRTNRRSFGSSTSPPLAAHSGPNTKFPTCSNTTTARRASS